jgi:SAM-dependent methyltransferase
MSTYTDAHYDEAFPEGVENHYWHLARNRVILRYLQAEKLQGLNVLDVGCGPGIMVDFLRRNGVSAYGCDTAAVKPLPGAKNSIFKGISAEKLPDEVRDSIHTVLYLDVLEHLEHPEVELRELRKLFKNAKRLVVTVPARQELWSSYDVHFGHFRRYNLKDVDSLFEALEPKQTSRGYFFHALYLPTRLQVLMKQERGLSTQSNLPHFLQKLIGWLLFWESRVVSRRVVGTSILATAEL